MRKERNSKSEDCDKDCKQKKGLKKQDKARCESKARKQGCSYTAMSRSRSVHSFMLGLFCSPSTHTMPYHRAGQGMAWHGMAGQGREGSARKRMKR